MDKKVTLSNLIDFKESGRTITAVSCYDYLTSRLCASAGVDMLLVGDSAAQWMLGFDSTLPATMDFMVAITAGVRRGAPNVCLAADMPFLSYHTGTAEAVKNAGRFIVEAGAEIIKIESTIAQYDVITALSDAGIPVMAHIGMRPQSGRFRAEGATAESAIELIELADQMCRAGAAALLLEGIAREVAKIITQRSGVPVISCGSGPDCDGQILIAPDILGLLEGPTPKFSRSYGKLAPAVTEAISDYVEQVGQGDFPDDEHCYHIKSGQFGKLMDMLKDPSF